MRRWRRAVLMWAIFPVLPLIANIEVGADGPAAEPADLIIHHAKIVTLDAKDRIVEALAVRGEKIIALGDDEQIFKLKGPKTRVIDADGRTALPGLYDSHTHPVSAATSELVEPIPNFKSL